MNFRVPQFIDIEDKIFGPLTFKQFIYLIGGGGAIFILYSLLPFYLAIWLIVPTAALALALAFYKVNNRPFVHMLEAATRYVVGIKMYLWKRRDKPIQPKTVEKKEGAAPVEAKRLSASKLRDLSWSLDVKENIK